MGKQRRVQGGMRRGGGRSVEGQSLVGKQRRVQFSSVQFRSYATVLWTAGWPGGMGGGRESKNGPTRGTWYDMGKARRGGER